VPRLGADLVDSGRRGSRPPMTVRAHLLPLNKNDWCAVVGAWWRIQTCVLIPFLCRTCWLVVEDDGFVV
jgi:hypothetical protein